jgi:hypothetical protein
MQSGFQLKDLLSVKGTYVQSRSGCGRAGVAELVTTIEDLTGSGLCSVSSTEYSASSVLRRKTAVTYIPGWALNWTTVRSPPYPVEDGTCRGCTVLSVSANEGSILGGINFPISPCSASSSTSVDPTRFPPTCFKQTSCIERQVGPRLFLGLTALCGLYSMAISGTRCEPLDWDCTGGTSLYCKYPHRRVYFTILTRCSRREGIDEM